MVHTVFRQRPIRPRTPWFRVELAGWFQFSWKRGVAVARHDPGLFLWNTLWLPFWIGSDAPRPGLPKRRTAAATPAVMDSAGAYLQSRIDRVTRRFAVAWLGGSLLRGFSLALVALTCWSLLAVLGLATLPGWASVIVAIGAGLGVGFVYGLLTRPDRLMVAGMLDRSFGLRERIVTAFDRPGDASHVSRIQLADAANTFDEIMTEVPRSTFVPVREAAICLIMTGALVTMLLAYVPRQGIAAVVDSPAPQFVPASERLAVRDQPAPRQSVQEQPTGEQASIAEIQERGRNSQSAREDLARIGEALQTHPFTQPAAESISSGDYTGAADSLRSASAFAASMSQEERDALADDLEQASRQISDANPDLAQAANEAAAALRDGGPEAEEALSALAEQIDETGDKVYSEEDLARDLDEAQSGSSDPAASGGEGAESDQSGSNQSQSSEQQGDEGAGSDPGEGSSAQPGVSNQPRESSGSESAQDGSEQGSGSTSSDNAGQEPTDGQQGDGASGQAGSDAEGGSSSSDQGLEGAPQDETNASQGSGAGTGQRGANDQGDSDQNVDNPGDPEENLDAGIPSVGEAGDPPASREDRGEEDDGTGTTRGGSTSLELQGTSDSSGIQTGGDSGSSSLGSGSGSSTASGDQTTGDAGVAGPDSNRVPDALRDVVKDYFGEPVP